MKKKFLVFLLILTHTFLLIAQPKNKSNIKVKCDKYVFNPSNMKIKISPDIAIILKMGEVSQKINTDSIYTNTAGCTQKIPIEFGPNLASDIKTALDKDIKPFSQIGNLDIVIKDFGLRYNMLPSLNKRMHLSMDLYTVVGGKRELKYSRTESFILLANSNLEKPMGKAVRNVLRDFFENKMYIKPIEFVSTGDKEENDQLNKGIYTSHFDLISNAPSIKLNYKVVSDSTNEIYKRYYLTDTISDKNIKDPTIYGFSDGKDIFINVLYYYPKNYFIKLNKFNDDFYFSFDRVYDYAQANSNTMAFGGGLLGAAIGAETAKSKSAILINISDGTMRAFSLSYMKKLLKEDNTRFEKYKIIVEKEDINGVKQFIKSLIADNIIG